MNAIPLDLTNEALLQTSPRRNYKKLLLTLGASAAIFGLVAYGASWAMVGRFIETTDDAYVSGDVTAIAPHVAGFISEINVQDNQRVRKGALLMRLDDRDFRAALEHAEAALADKQAVLANLKAKYAAQQSTIHEDSADLSAKIAQAEFARKDSARYQHLLQAVATSKQDVEKAATADQVAQSSVAAARATLAGGNQQLQ